MFILMIWRGGGESLQIKNWSVDKYFVLIFELFLKHLLEIQPAIIFHYIVNCS